MKNIYLLSLHVFLCFLVFTNLFAYTGIIRNEHYSSLYKSACVRPQAKYIMQVNNVRAGLLSGGDLFSVDGYISPSPRPGQLPVSGISAAGVWLGGRDRAGNIKVSASTYRNEGGDFFSGPLDINGTTEKSRCDQWDKIFTIKGSSIERHIQNYKIARELNIPMECDAIPDDIKYWPAQGNAYFIEKYNWLLPDQPLASYQDMNNNGIYDPCQGDYPSFFSIHCEYPFHQGNRIPSEINFYIFNDNGGPQTLSGPSSMQAEFQVNAFAYASNDEINDMTFYEYKIINKAAEDLIDCYFSWWVDPDLGCPEDDYFGCDPFRNMAYIYNEDEVDGNPDQNCSGTNTYGDNIPIIGFDIVKGPLVSKVFKRNADGQFVLDESGNKIVLDPSPYTGEQDTLVEGGLSSFTYMVNGVFGSFPWEIQRKELHFYNYMRGLWRDGTPLTFGGSGYNPGSIDTVRYAFPDDPNKNTGWSMCTADLPYADRMFLMSTGPMHLQPGATRELTMSVFTAFDHKYPCPDLSKLKYVNGLAQQLMDNCFENVLVGPDAPDLNSIEKDKELTLILSNNIYSNNFNEKFILKQFFLPESTDSFYRFEGYKVFQLRSAGVSTLQLNDTTYAREIFQTDLNNQVSDISNWVPVLNPDTTSQDSYIWVPVQKVKANNTGIQYSYNFNEDHFAEGDKTLVNGKEYYFMAIAYAHNNWKQYDPVTKFGQKTPYLQGLSNIKRYAFKPTQTFAVDDPLIKVTRLSGEGNPSVFLEMEEGMYDKILSPNFNGKIVYKPGFGPIQCKIIYPSIIKYKKYRLEITGNFLYGRSECVFDNEALWNLKNITDNEILLQDKPLSYIKEYVVNELGFSITLHNFPDPGTGYNTNNGSVGAKLEYMDPNKVKWYSAVTDGGKINGSKVGELNFIRNYTLDPFRALSNIGNGFFVPFLSTRFTPDPDLPFYLSPAARDLMAIMTNSTNNSIRYRDLNNVDIVFTNDKTKWSKCIVVETASNDFINNGLPTIDNTKNFEVRRTPSIDKDGKPMNDGTYGFSYFPGYAIDVETGKRLNIFFGENSVYSGSLTDQLDGKNPIGGDLIFNPSSQTETEVGLPVWGAQHYIYVTRQEYDECKKLEGKLRKGASIINKIKGGASVTWVSFPLGVSSAPLLSIDKGLIPNDLIVKLRVENPYGESRKFDIEKERDCSTYGDHPVYEFEFEPVLNQTDDHSESQDVHLAPNPFYRESGVSTFDLYDISSSSIIQLYDMQGRLLKTWMANDHKIEKNCISDRSCLTFHIDKGVLSVSHIYFLRITDSISGKTVTKKWLII